MAGAERTFTVRLLGDATSAQRAFSDVAGSAEHTESRFSAFASGVGRSMVAAGLAVGGLAAASVPLINAASNLSETQSKVGVIFGDAAGEIDKFASTAAKSLGQSKQQAMDAAATFATFGKSAGLSGTNLATFSTDLTGLASDLASFNNTSPEEAIEAIGAALRGEAEPMRRYGVLLDDATMRQKAFEMGLISSTKEALTPANKVLAAQALIMAKTSDAQGDFARTSDGLANKQRILSAQFANVQAQIGEKLLPVALRLATWASETMIPALFELGRNLEGPLTSAFDTVSRVMREDVLPVVQTVFGWLQQNVPPLLAAVRSGAEAAFGWMGANIPGIFQGIVDAFRTFYDAGAAIVAFLRDHWEVAVGIAVGALAGLGALIYTTVIPALVAKAAAWWAVAAGVIAANAPFVAIGVAIAALTAGIVWAYRNVDWFRDSVDAVARFLVGTLWPALKTVAEFVVDNVIPIFVDVAKAAVDFGRDVFDVASDVVSKVGDIVAAFVDLGVKIGSAVAGIVTTLAGWVVSVWQLGGEVISFFRDLPGKIGDFFLGLGETILEPFRTAFNAIARLWNRTVGRLSFEAPSWVPGIGGRGWSMPTIPEFHQGGIVPGTGEMLAVLQGGEGVFTKDQMRAMDGQGQNVVVNINVNGGLGGPERIGAATADAVRRELAVLLRGAVA